MNTITITLNAESKHILSNNGIKNMLLEIEEDITRGAFDDYFNSRVYEVNGETVATVEINIDEEEES